MWSRGTTAKYQWCKWKWITLLRPTTSSFKIFWTSVTLGFSRNLAPWLQMGQTKANKLVLNSILKYLSSRLCRPNNSWWINAASRSWGKALEICTALTSLDKALKWGKFSLRFSQSFQFKPPKIWHKRRIKKMAIRFPILKMSIKSQQPIKRLKSRWNKMIKTSLSLTQTRRKRILKIK